MNIETLRNRYVFKKDEHSITLYKRMTCRDKESSNYGQEYDSLIGHYSRLQSVIDKIVFLELIDAGTVNDLLADLQVVVPSIKAALQGVKQ